MAGKGLPVHLIQLLLPVVDNDGQRFSNDGFEAVRRTLTKRFGGLTAFVQSPALGLWKDAQSGATERDDMILIEVMVETVDHDGWAGCRRELERTFRQDEIVIRALAFERL